jgi:NTE family protein
MAMHAFNVMLEQQLIVALGQPHPGVELIVVTPLCPVTVSGADFSATDELIERAERATKAWLANGHQPVAGLSRALGRHGH